MDKRLEGALHIILAIAIVVGVILFWPNMAALKQYGYVGAFAISALCSATILLPVPGWAFVVAMSHYLNPYLLGIAAGTGSALGELPDTAWGRERGRCSRAR